MLVQQIYTILDTKAESYSQPVFAVNDAVATRLFSASVNRHEDTDLFHHPEDYQLYRIGEWNAAEGRVHGHEGVCIARGQDVKTKETTNGSR